MRIPARKAILAALILVIGLAGPACKKEAAAPGGAIEGTGGPRMAISREAFGSLPDGTPVDIYALKNKSGLEARIMTYGGILVSLMAPDRAGVLADVTLGFDTLAGYLGTHPYLGAIVGRYGNRIAKARFAIDGVEYRLAANNNANSLNGGLRGLDKVVWGAEAIPAASGSGLRLTYISKDGEEGCPGNLAVAVVYTLTEASELRIDYEARGGACGEGTWVATGAATSDGVAGGAPHPATNTAATRVNRMMGKRCRIERSELPLGVCRVREYSLAGYHSLGYWRLKA